MLTNYVAATPALGPALVIITPTLLSMLVGLVAGAAALVVVSAAQRLRSAMGAG